jgi:hypothetical protein
MDHNPLGSAIFLKATRLNAHCHAQGGWKIAPQLQQPHRVRRQIIKSYWLSPRRSISYGGSRTLNTGMLYFEMRYSVLSRVVLHLAAILIKGEFESSKSMCRCHIGLFPGKGRKYLKKKKIIKAHFQALPSCFMCCLSLLTLQYAVANSVEK